MTELLRLARISADRLFFRQQLDGISLFHLREYDAYDDQKKIESVPSFVIIAIPSSIHLSP